MKKGINKIILVIVSALLILMPFSYSIKADETIIDWDSYGVATYQIGAYSYWYEYGLSNIAYQEQQSTGFVITTTYGQHNYNITREGVLGNDYSKFYVYNMNGVRLGEYHSSYHTTTPAGVQRNYITYINSNKVQAQCESCYIGFETDENDIIRLTETSYNSSTTGNDTYVNRLQFVVPSLKGVYSHPTTYNNRFKGISYKNDEYVISFMSNLKLQYKTPTLQLISDRDISALTLSQVNQTNIGNWDLRTYKVVNNGNSALPFDWYISNFNNQNVEIIPIYQGSVAQMPADLYQLAYGNKYIYETHDNELIQLMNNGNSGSQSAVDDADITNNDFQNVNDNFSNLEGDFSSNMNNSLNAIDTNLNVNNLSGFVYGANWVKTQFDFMINNYEPVELLVTYSLILGLAMLLIGKRLL